MNRTQLAAEIKRVSKLSGTFELRSGATSDTYFDKYLFESDPKLLAAIAKQMKALIPQATQVLCGLEMGGIPVVTALSHATALPAVYIRKQPKTYGTRKYAEGPSLIGKRIVLIEDVVSSGGAILDAVSKLRADGIAVDVAICIIDRQSGGREALYEQRVELRSVFTMEEIESAG